MDMINGTIDEHCRKVMYDNFALGNECERFGIIAGCKPHCPVFERGECELQQDNTEMFLKNGWL